MSKMQEIRHPIRTQFFLLERLLHTSMGRAQKDSQAAHSRRQRSVLPSTLTLRDIDPTWHVDGADPIVVDPMPLEFFVNFVPENALDGSGSYEWSSESRKLFDTKGKIRNRPKVPFRLFHDNRLMNV